MSEGTQEKTVRLRIFGRVQGVFFRAWTVEEATRRGLAGWVRNRRDGSVEVLVSGPAGKVAEMVAACREGPPYAIVSRVEEGPAEETVSGPGFRQAPTE